MNKQLDICFVDLSGLSYSAETLHTGTVGGSEAAILNLVETFSELQHNVTVFNDCEQEGKFNNVVWLDKSKIPTIKKKFDVVISSRCLDSCDPHNAFFVDGTIKILWLHDYFLHPYAEDANQAEGLELIATYLKRNWVDYVFTLSDWHTHYLLQNMATQSFNGHGLYKNRIIQTRNGFKPWPQESNTRKDKNKFIYFSNVGRGLHQLLEQWSTIKLSIPDAQLHIIGGSYTDDNEKTSWLIRYKEEYANDNSIHFIPGMPQAELFKELASAYLTIYPCKYAETFCISALDSMYNGTPLVTSKFGALEQTAIPEANVLVDGMALEPDYFIKYIPALARLYYDEEYWISKVEACNIVRNGYVSWQSVAKEWLAIFSKLVSKPIDVEITDEATRSISWVNKTFNCHNTTIDNLNA